MPSESLRSNAANNTNPKGVETLRISVADIDKAFGAMNVELDSPKKRRRHGRYKSLGLTRVVLEIIQPGGNTAALVVQVHNISKGGLGVVNGRYLYPESKCKCWIRRQDGELATIKGEIHWCRHVNGIVHICGIGFDRKINVEDFQELTLDDNSYSDFDKEAGKEEIEVSNMTVQEAEAPRRDLAAYAAALESRTKSD